MNRSKFNARQYKLSLSHLFFCLFALILVVLFILFCIQIVLAQNISKDVSVVITLDNVTEFSNYTKFVKLTNNDDELNINDNLSLVINIFTSQFNHSSNSYYDLYSNELINGSSWMVSKTINSYSETGFGTLNVLNNNFYLCVNATPLNFFDYNLTNNYVCKEFILLNLNLSETNLNESYENNQTNESNELLNLSLNTTLNMSVNISSNISVNISSNISNMSFNNSEIIDINTSQFSCDCHLKINTVLQIYEKGDKLIFEISDCSSNSKFNQTVEYWIEDSTGIVKAKINTTSKSEKSFTPTFDSQEKYYLIRAKFSECIFISEKLVVFKSSDFKNENIKNTYFELIVPDEEDSNVLYVGIDGYKGNTSKTLVSLWVEKSGKKYSDITKFYVINKYSTFSFKLPILLDVEDAGKYKVIVEGLDEREEKSIGIIRYKDSENSKDALNINLNENYFFENEKIESESEISSFYTLKKIFAENITVYVNVKNPSNFSLEIMTLNHEYKIYNLSTKNQINITIINENETIIAKLLNDEEIIDVAYLKLNLTIKTSEDLKDSLNEVYLNLTNRNLIEESNGNAENNEIDKNIETNKDIYSKNIETKNIENEDNENNSSSIFASNKITGAMVFENFKLEKKNAIFVIVAIVICFLLFHKKTKQKILNFIKAQLKKTKFFK